MTSPEFGCYTDSQQLAFVDGGPTNGQPGRFVGDHRDQGETAGRFQQTDKIAGRPALVETGGVQHFQYGRMGRPGGNDRHGRGGGMVIWAARR